MQPAVAVHRADRAADARRLLENGGEKSRLLEVPRGRQARDAGTEHGHAGRSAIGGSHFVGRVAIHGT
jgi:hypothetical protein